tara:strand:+ start:4151 stop:5554 length:1404 start_codon:yes stop_codon:yes gene_type:complete
MGTLTNGVISTTYKNIIFTDKTSSGVGDIYYTDGSDNDVRLTTLTSALTLTAIPTFTGGIKLGSAGLIQDSGGNEAIHITTTGSAVNYLKVIPSATNNAVSLDVDGSDSNIGLTLDAKGSGIVTCTPNLVVTGDVIVTGNDIKSGNAASSTTAITLSSDDVTIVGDLTVTGTSSGTMTLGADADGTDRSLVFGHSTLKSIIGIDDNQDVFAINTDAAFEADNDVEIDATGNVTVNNGSIQCATIDYKDGDNAITIADGGAMTIPQQLNLSANLHFNSALDIRFPDASGLEIKDDGGSAYMSCISDVTTFAQACVFSGTVDLNGITDAVGMFGHLYTATEAKTADFTAAVNKTYIITKADGCDVTLPAPTKGARIKLVFGKVTSNNHTITTNTTTTLYNGWVLINDSVSGSVPDTAPFAPDGTDDDVITLNGTTQGSSGVIELIGTAANRWWVEGRLEGDGTPATPFA